jgi:hypothetical protein
MGADMVLYGSSKHAEHEVEKVEVPAVPINTKERR